MASDGVDDAAQWVEQNEGSSDQQPTGDAAPAATPGTGA